MLFASAPGLAGFFDEPGLGKVLRFLGLIALFKAVDIVPHALLRRDFRFRYLALRAIISTIAGGAVGISLALHGYGIWALVAQQLTAAVTLTVITWLGLGWIPGFLVRWVALKRLLSSGLYLMGSMLANQVGRDADNLFIGTVLGTRDLGLYNIGFKISQTANSLLVNALSRLGVPTFSPLQDEPERLADAYERIWTMGAALTLPVFMLIMATAPKLVPLLFGDQWQESAFVVQVLMVAGCCQALRNFDGQLLIACGKAKVVFKLTLVRSLLSLTGIAIAVHWGIHAVAAALALSALLMLPLWKLAVESHTPVSVKRANAALPQIACGLLALVGVSIMITHLDGIFPIAALLAMQWSLGLIVYAIAVYLLSGAVRAGVHDILRTGFGNV